MEHHEIHSHAFEPLEPDDFWLFLDAASIQKEHRTRGLLPDTDHQAGDRRGCPGCQHAALGALLAYAGRASERAWDRQEAIDDLREHPATYDSMAKEGRRRESPAMGRLAKPYDAAFGASYFKAFERARSAGQLAVPVRTAQEFLGFAIEAAQDEHGPIEPGHVLPWDAIGRRLAAGPYPLPDGLEPWQLWVQVEVACRAAGRAATLLEDHVFRHSALASRHTAAEVASDDGDTFDLVAEASEDDGLVGGRDTDDRGIAVRAAAALVRLGRVDDATSRRAVLRVISDSFGPDAVHVLDPEVAEDLAADAAAIARRDLAVQCAAEAVRHLSANAAADAATALRAAILEHGVEHPYDLSTPEGVEAHGRWVGVLTRDVLRTAQDLRLGRGRR